MNTKNITKEELTEIISTVTATVINQLTSKDEGDTEAKEQPTRKNTEYLVEVSLGHLNDDGRFDSNTRIFRLRGSDLEKVTTQAVQILVKIPKGEVTARVDVYTYEFGGSEEHRFEGTKYARFAVTKFKAKLIEMASKNDYRVLLEHIKESAAQREREAAAKAKSVTDTLYTVEVSSGALYDDGTFDVAETICYNGYNPTEIIREAVRRLAGKETKVRKEITVFVKETAVDGFGKDNPRRSERYERYVVEPSGEVKFIDGVMKGNYLTLLAHIKKSEGQKEPAKSDALRTAEESIWREIPEEARKIAIEAMEKLPCIQFKFVPFGRSTSEIGNIGLWIYPKRAEVKLEGINTDTLPTAEGVCIAPVVIKGWNKEFLYKQLGYTQRGYILRTIIDALNSFFMRPNKTIDKTHELYSLLEDLSMELNIEMVPGNRVEPKKASAANVEGDCFIPRMDDKSYAILAECGVFAEDDYFIPKVFAFVTGNNFKKIKSNAIMNIVSQLECDEWKGKYRNEIIVRVRRYTRGDDGKAIGYEPVYERYAIETGGATTYLGELPKAGASSVIKITDKRRGINLTKVFYGTTYAGLQNKEEEFIADLANGIDGTVDVTVSAYTKDNNRYYMSKKDERSLFYAGE